MSETKICPECRSIIQSKLDLIKNPYSMPASEVGFDRAIQEVKKILKESN